MRLADPAFDAPTGKDFRAASVREPFPTEAVRTWAERAVSLSEVSAVAVSLSETSGSDELRILTGAEHVLSLEPSSGRRRARGRAPTHHERTLYGPDGRSSAVLAVDFAFDDAAPGDALVELLLDGLVSIVELTWACEGYRRQSDRYLAERDRANASSRAFDAAFEESIVGMALVPLRTEAAGRLGRVNDPLRRITGLSDDQLQAITFVDLLQPEYRRIPESAYRRVLAGRRAPFKADGLLCRGDGSETWVRITGSPLLDDMGDPHHLLLQVEELSQRRAPEIERAEEIDAGTGLLNAQAFGVAIAEAADRAHRSGDPAAVFLTRIDSWPGFVERHGTAAAKELQRQMADRLRDTLRLDDVVATLSDGEFAFLAQELTQDSAARVGLRVGSALSAPYRIDGQELSLDVTLGAAMTGAGPGSTGNLTQRARAATEHAQRQPPQAGSSFRLRIECEPSSAAAERRHADEDAPQIYRHRRR